MRTNTLRPVGRPARTPPFGDTGKQCTHGSWIGSTNLGHWREHAPHTLVDGEAAPKGDADSRAVVRFLHSLMSTVRDTVLEDTAVVHRACHTDNYNRPSQEAAVLQPLHNLEVAVSDDEAPQVAPVEEDSPAPHAEAPREAPLAEAPLAAGHQSGVACPAWRLLAEHPPCWRHGKDVRDIAGSSADGSSPPVGWADWFSLCLLPEHRQPEPRRPLPSTLGGAMRARSIPLQT